MRRLMKIRKCNNCCQTPELRKTGWSGKWPEWYCPVCKAQYWVEDEKLIKESSKWGSKKIERRF
jgi:hypothetical protein